MSEVFVKKKVKKDPFEKAFGKAPKKGYKFSSVEVSVIDNDSFKGFDIAWSAVGIGFGHVVMAWGLDMKLLKDSPDQQGFYTGTEYMSDAFVQALMKKAAPLFADIIIKHDKDSNRKNTREII